MFQFLFIETILSQMTNCALLLEAIVHPLDITTQLNNEAARYLNFVLLSHY